MKQCLGGFYRSNNNFTNIRTQGIPREHCTSADVALVKSIKTIWICGTVKPPFKSVNHLTCEREHKGPQRL